MISLTPEMLDRAQDHALVIAVQMDLEEKLAIRRWYLSDVGRRVFAPEFRQVALHDNRVQVVVLCKVLRRLRRVVR